VPSAEERRQIERSISQKFTGEKAGGRFVLSFSEDRTRTPEIVPISMSDADKQFLALQELLVQNILTAHRVTSPMLMGIKNDTGLGSNVDELNAAANFYLNTVVKPFQDHIVKTLRKIFQVNNMDMPVNFVQLKPITVQFTSEDLKGVMTQDEIREEIGLEPLDTEVEVKANLAKVGSMITDGIELPLFETKEEAEAEAKKLGCSGSHIHTQDGKEYYMPCENHDQIKKINADCNCKLSSETELTELSKFIKEFGEDIPEDWELVDEEVVDGEHQDFNYETELNKAVNEKYDFAVSTGTARPNARSEQDGLNRSGNDFYKVRYVYTKDDFLRQEGETREFCKLMMAAKKVWRKEDIIRLNDIAVNPGWGPRGANTYSIWLADQYEQDCNSLKTNKLELYKGGGNCHHFWLRRIYKTSLRGAKSKINDNQIISYTKALSEGFTVEKNDNLVARPPKRMINQGFLEPR
jgi:hypothetical protein